MIRGPRRWRKRVSAWTQPVRVHWEISSRQAKVGVPLPLKLQIINNHAQEQQVDLGKGGSCFRMLDALASVVIPARSEAWVDVTFVDVALEVFATAPDTLTRAMPELPELATLPELALLGGDGGDAGRVDRLLALYRDLLDADQVTADDDFHGSMAEEDDGAAGPAPGDRVGGAFRPPCPHLIATPQVHRTDKAGLCAQ